VTRYRPLWVPDSFSPVAKPRFVLENGALRLVPLPFRDRAELVHAIESDTILDVLAEDEYWSRGPMPALVRWSALARLVNARRVYATHVIESLWSRPGEPFEVTLALLERFRTLARGERSERRARAGLPRARRPRVVPRAANEVLVDPARRARPARRALARRLRSARGRRPFRPRAICTPRAATSRPRGDAIVAETLLGWLRERYS
jgi:hypothetical protein